MGHADCLVIGGGVVGCSIAWRLAQAGVTVTLLERGVPGAEASSAAAGILAGQEEAQRPDALANLALASRALFPALADELLAETGRAIGYRRDGIVSVALDAAQAASLRERYAWMSERGLPWEWLEGAALRARAPGVAGAAAGAASFAEDAQLDPPAYAQAVALAAEQAGVTVRAGVEVLELRRSGDRVVGVETTSGPVLAGTVVVAAGSWSTRVARTGLPAEGVRPLRGQIVKLVGQTPPLHGVLVSPRGGYLVGRPDGTVLAGSTIEDVGFDRQVTAGGVREILDMAFELLPGLSLARVDGFWANFRPATRDGLPLLGRGAVEGLVWATGHHRHGILLSPVTALHIRDVVLGRPVPDLAAFDPARLAVP